MSALSKEVHDRAVELLARDVLATIGPSYVDRIRAYASFYEGIGVGDDEFTETLVDWFQQEFHDDFVDTTWPSCPRHPNHPLWYGEGWWWCDKDDVRVAELGSLTPKGTRAG